MAHVEKTEKMTHCPFKGLATYYVIRGRQGEIRDAVAHHLARQVRRTIEVVPGTRRDVVLSQLLSNPTVPQS